MEPHRTAVDRHAGADPDTGTIDTLTPARIEALSDGVFAIVITLLAIDLRVPREEALEGRSLAEALASQWPVYVAYVLSFLQIGVIWANHHMMFHYIRRADHLLKVFTLLLLLCVAVLPFTTALLAEYVRRGGEDARLAALLYAGAIGLAGVFFSATWWHALRAGLVDPRADPHLLHALRWHWLLVPAFYAIACALAFVNVWLSVSMYVVLLLYYALPGPAVIRGLTARRAHAHQRRAAAAAR